MISGLILSTIKGTIEFKSGLILSTIDSTIRLYKHNRRHNKIDIRPYTKHNRRHNRRHNRIQILPYTKHNRKHNRIILSTIEGSIEGTIDFKSGHLPSKIRSTIALH